MWKADQQWLNADSQEPHDRRSTSPERVVVRRLSLCLPLLAYTDP